MNVHSKYNICNESCQSLWQLFLLLIISSRRGFHTSVSSGGWTGPRRQSGIWPTWGDPGQTTISGQAVGVKGDKLRTRSGRLARGCYRMRDWRMRHLLRPSRAVFRSRTRSRTPDASALLASLHAEIGLEEAEKLAVQPVGRFGRN